MTRSSRGWPIRSAARSRTSYSNFSQPGGAGEAAA
jgi:hypothetical protein